jgi:hypothetical protein
MVFSESFKEKYRKKATHFTRNRKMPFARVVLFIMGIARKSLQLELTNFMNLFSGKEGLDITNSGYNQNRMKIKKGLFKGLVKELNKDFYTGNEGRVKLWNGFRLLGCDGSTMALPPTKELLKLYGCKANQSNTQIAIARCSLLYDLQNNMAIDGIFAPMSVGERDLALQHLRHCNKGDLLIFDRGYPSYPFVEELAKKNLNFLIRCKHSFNKAVRDFVDSAQSSIVINLKPGKDTKNKGKKIDKASYVVVRLVKVILDSGEIEVLMTSLLDDEKYPVSVFKDLYFMRWGVETFYDVLKNIIQVEKFTGYSHLVIQQDFYCALFIANIQSLLVGELEGDVKEKCKERKLEYKINTNLAFGFVKQEIIKIFIEEDSTSIEKKLKKLFLKNLVPIRPGRKNKREVDKYNNKKKPPFFTNFKTAL